MTGLPPRNRPPLWHPASLIATVGGIGYLPKAPGTWASAFAVLAAVGLHQTSAGAIAGAAAAATAIGLVATHSYLKRSAIADPPEVVIDELGGQWLTLAALPFGALAYALGFLAFRVFDIVKPWPIPWIEQRSGAWGVVLDDLMAGLYAAVTTMLILGVVDLLI